MSRLGLTNQDYLNLLIIYGESGKILSRTCALFRQRYPDRPIPSKDVVRRLLKNCLEHGQFRPKLKKSKIIDDEVVEIGVMGYFYTNPTASLREAATTLEISTMSIQRVLKRHKWRPFSYQQVQHLHPQDFLNRVNFCEFFTIACQDDENFTKKIIWTDEAKFTKNGLFNKHNSHFWAAENPHVTRERGYQESWQFNVFCAIKDTRILCLHFYNENLNGERYLDILRNIVEEELDTLPIIESNTAWYQMDGAPAHSTRDVHLFLERLFDGKFIANAGPYLWPPRSPDLTPMDFFLWGYVKDKVYSTPVTTAEETKERIRVALNSLTEAQIQKVTSNQVLKRINKCLELNGANFEQNLK